MTVGLLLVVLVAGALPSGPGRGAVSYPGLSVPPLLMTLAPDLPLAGGVVTVDVQSFLAGVATDADAVPTASAQMDGGSQAVTLARVGLGHYRGTFALPPANADATARVADGLVIADATIAGVSQGTGARFRWLQPGFAIRVLAETSRIVPSEVLHLTAEVYRDGAPLDPDTIRAIVTQGSARLGGNLTPTRLGLGVYAADVVLPSSMAVYPPPNAVFTATSGGASFGGGLILHAPRYQVWLHQLPSPSQVLRGELWVANGTGSPVAGVSLAFTNITGMPVNGTTDARGAFPVYINGSGVIGWGTTVQVAAGTPFGDEVVLAVVPRQGSAVVPLDPVLSPGGTARDYLRPGEPVTRSFRLMNETASETPLADTLVSYYVYSLHRFVASGTATTDASGSVTVTFAAPSGGTQIAFLAGSRLLGFAGFTVGSPDVSLQSAPLVLGGLTQVDLSVSPEFRAALDADPVVVWDVRPLVLATGESWSLLTSEWDEDFARTDTGIRHTFALPSFLPSSGPYLVSGSLELDVTTFAQFGVVNPGEGAAIPFNTTFSAPGSAAAALVVVSLAVGAGAVALLAAWFVLRRRRAPPAS